MRHLLHFTRTREAQERHAFRLGREEYQLQGEGRTVATATLDWSEALLKDLSALRSPNSDPSVVQRVGERIRKFLDKTGWSRHEAEINRAVQSGQPVFLTVSSNAAELYALPWELMTIEATGQRLGELPGVLIRYAWPGTSSKREAFEAAAPPEGGRILLASSDSAGAVPLEQHCKAIEVACQRGHCQTFFNRKRDVVRNVSLGDLAEFLKDAHERGEPVAILHVLCHGTSRGQNDEIVYGLSWHDDQGRPTFVSPDRLRAFLSQEFAHSVRLVVLATCDSGNPGAFGNLVGAAAQAAHLAGIPAVIGSRFPLSIHGATYMAEEFYGALLGSTCSLEDSFLAARGRLLQVSSGGLDWASLQLYARPEDGDNTRPAIFRPYRGLLAFHAEHTRFFFGRTAEREEILSNLRALAVSGKPRFLVVAGASGTGKSSMVFAGVIPELMRNPTWQLGLEQTGNNTPPWHVEIIRPGDSPLHELNRTLDPHFQPTRGRDVGRDVAPEVDVHQPLLFVIDPFEEVFTQTDDPEVRTAFVRRLWSLASEEDRFHCIVLLRVDFLGHCGEIIVDSNGLRLDRIAYDKAHGFFVAHITPEAIRKAIEKPAAMVGLSPQAGLADLIVADVEGEPGFLPLLQYTLDLLWQDRQGRQFTTASYAKLGRVAGALQRKADSVLAELNEEFGDEGVAHARRLLVQMVDVRENRTTDTRRRVQLADVARDDTSVAVLDRLIEARLVVRDQHHGQTVVEVAHEELIRKWDRLREWLAEDLEKILEFEKLHEMVRQYQEYKALLQGDQLGYARLVQSKYPDEVKPETARLIAESEAAVKAGQRRRKIALVAFAVLTIVMAVAAVLAIMATRDARKSEEVAKGNAKHARDAVRMSVARGLAESDPSTALLLLREVEASNPIHGLLGWWDALIRWDNMRQSTWITKHRLRGHSDAVHSIAFSPDGTRIVTASSDRIARVWKYSAGQWKSRPLEGHSGELTSAAFSPDGTRVVTASFDKTARVWTEGAGSWTSQTLKGHSWHVSSAAFSPDGTRIVTASWDGTARVWVHSNGEWISSSPLKGHSDEVKSAAFSPDGKHIVTASSDGTARVWTRNDGRWTSQTLRGHSKALNSAAFSPDGNHIVTASWDNTARVWTKTRRSWVSRPLEGHLDTVTSAAFSPDGNHIVTASFDKTARVWTRSDGSWTSWTSYPLKGHSDMVASAAFSPDGNHIVTASWDFTARLWTRSAFPLTFQPLEGHSKKMISAAFSPDGNHIVAASWGNVARVWTRAAGRWTSHPLQGHSDTVISARFSPDGNHIVTASWDHMARVWTRSAGQWTSHPLQGHSDKVFSAQFSPDGDHIVTASWDHTAHVWTRAAGHWTSHPLEGHSDKVTSATFSPDGNHVVTASWDHTARVWTHTAGQWTSHPLEGHSDKVTSAGFSPDGRHIVTASLDDTARVWTRERDQWSSQPLESYSRNQHSAAFSPDGTRVLTASDSSTADGITARVWMAIDGQWTSQSLMGHGNSNSAVLALAFSPDVTRIVTTLRDNTARVWILDPRDLLARLWREIPDCLSAEARRELLGETLRTARENEASCRQCVAHLLNPDATFPCPQPPHADEVTNLPTQPVSPSNTTRP